MKINQLTLRRVAGVMAIALCVAASASARSTVKLQGRESSGFNALNHVLQKPLGNDTFPSGQHFGNNMFINIGAGASAIYDEQISGLRPGAHLSGQLGGWITPVHGIRAGINAGIHSAHKGADRAWFGGVQADYLLNISSLMRGYDPSRRFELIGALGLEYDRTRKMGVWGNQLGAAAALQFRFNVAPSMFLYLEPRMLMIGGSRFDQPYDWRRLRTEFSFNLGLGYRILRGARRAQGSVDFRQKNDDNLFFGVGAGIWDMTRNNFPSHMLRERNLQGLFYVGKMFSSASGLRISAQGGEYAMRGDNTYLAIGSLDYVLNLNSAFGGYRPREVFQLMLNVGVSAAYVRGDGRKLVPGVNVGLEGLFRLSPNWGLFIEPQLYAFRSSFAQKLKTSNAPMAAVSLGLRYTIGDFSRLSPESYEAYADAKHWFITMGVGGAKRFRGDYGSGAIGSIGFGKRFTPSSSWRLTLEGTAYPRSPRYLGLSVAADYLVSLTTPTCGYDPDRVFDLQGVLGVYAGAANYEPSIDPAFGVKAGLHADFRLSNAIDLFIEPQLLAMHCPVRGGTGWVPEARVMVGLNYKLGTPRGMRGNISETPYGDRRNFVSLSAGPNAFSGAVSTRNLNLKGAMDVAVGRWFSMVSGLRLTYGNDWLLHNRRTLNVGSLHLDYLMNLTSFYDRSASRKFHMIAMAGVGMAYCGNAHSSVGPMVTGGLQFRYNLPCNIDLHIEPAVTALPNRVLPSPGSPHRFTMLGRLMVGASYRF